MAVLDFHVEDPNEKPGNVTTQLIYDAFASVDTEVLSIWWITSSRSFS